MQHDVGEREWQALRTHPQEVSTLSKPEVSTLLRHPGIKHPGIKHPGIKHDLQSLRDEGYLGEDSLKLTRIE